MNVMPAWAFETRNLVMKNLLWLWNVCRYMKTLQRKQQESPPAHNSSSALHVLQRAIVHTPSY